MARTIGLWTREFSCYFTPKISAAYEAAYACPYATNPLLKVIPKDQSGLIISNYQLLLRRYYVTKRYHQICNYLNT